MRFAALFRSSFGQAVISFLTGIGVVWAMHSARQVDHGKGLERPIAPAESGVDPAAELWERVRVRVERADRESHDFGAGVVERLRNFFDDRRPGVDEFVSSVLSVEGKWAFLKSRAGMSEPEAYGAYVLEQFGGAIFSPEEIKLAVELEIGRYLKDLERIDNELLVSIRADIAELSSERMDLGDALSISHGSRGIISGATGSVRSELGVDVLREAGVIISEIVAVAVVHRVALGIAARAGVSAGILGTGAAASLGTFGVGLGAAIAVDYAASRAFERFYNPKAELALEVGKLLDEMEHELIEGNQRRKGLEEILKLHCAEHIRVRNMALRNFFGESALVIHLQEKI